jgi:hypothetical protein
MSTIAQYESKWVHKLQGPVKQQNRVALVTSEIFAILAMRADITNIDYRRSTILADNQSCTTSMSFP